ncbi:MAG: ParB/RepB/Spo0J family partition protein [Symbiobacteriaceae bacterium]|nr:ParB/RepB/Spo0J family partition protein [Symbiobacteriaceae bacterium]
MPAKAPRGLGRGLNALLRPQPGDEQAVELKSIDIDRISSGKHQPRRSFSQESLQELAASIKANGVLEPILLRPLLEGYEIVAGERRLRAAKLAGLKEVPAIVRFYDDKQAAEIGLIENLQREELNPIDEAIAFNRLIKEHGFTQEELASRIGKSRSHMANTLRLLQLPEPIQEQLIAGELEMGHARSLLSLPHEQQLGLAQEVRAKGLTVRQIEARVRALSETARGKTKGDLASRSSAESWEGRLQGYLQTKVRILRSGSGGKIEIPFNNPEELERLLTIICSEGK